MKAIVRRIGRLEQHFEVPDYQARPRDHLRIVVSQMDHDLSLETSTCTRTLTANGCLTETVRLDGIRGALTDEALNRFVERFPIQQLAQAGQRNRRR